MAILHRGQDTGSGDINIAFTVGGNPQDPVEVYVALYYVEGGQNILVDNNPQRQPVRYDVGKFYVAYHITMDANLGKYLAIWTYKPTSDSALRQECDEWYVVAESTITNPDYTETEQVAINDLRLVLRDNNPDRNYHFRPPTDEVVIAGYTEAYGFIWQDHELYEYLQLAVHELNLTPPELMGYTLESVYTQYQFLTPLIKTSAMRWALNAIAINWAADEFSYSINGVSLDINKFDKYMQLKANAETRYTQIVELYRASVHIIKGIRPSMYTISAGRSGSGLWLGPSTSGLNPANFIRSLSLSGYNFGYQYK